MFLVLRIVWDFWFDRLVGDLSLHSAFSYLTLLFFVVNLTLSFLFVIWLLQVPRSGISCLDIISLGGISTFPIPCLCSSLLSSVRSHYGIVLCSDIPLMVDSLKSLLSSVLPLSPSTFPLSLVLQGFTPLKVKSLMPLVLFEWVLVRDYVHLLSLILIYDFTPL